MNVECCWIQTIHDRKKQQLSLAADRGFNDKIRSEISSMDLSHDFCIQVIGMGNKIIIPDLNNSGAYGMASFRSTGFKWLVAVPLMTYRAYGLLGAASKNRRILEKDTADFIMVIAGLIANALSKAHFTGSFIRRSNKPPELVVAGPKVETKSETVQEAPLPDTQTEIAPVTPAANEPAPEPPPALKAEQPSVPLPSESPPKKIDAAFHSHRRKMENFRKAHG